MNIKDYLKDKGFGKVGIEKVLTTYPICDLSEEKIVEYIKNTFHYFLNHEGIPKNLFYGRNVVDIIVRKPNIITYSNQEKDNKLTYYDEKGIDQLTVFEKSLTYPSIFTIGKDKLDLRFEYFDKYGYDKKKIRRIVSLLPQSLGYDESKLDSVHQFFQGKKYEKEEVVDVISRNPKLYSYSDLKLNDAWDNLKDKTGFNDDVIKFITFNCPFVFGMSLENMNSKLDIFKYFDLLEVISKDPNRLIQSAEVTYVRGMYFKENNIHFDQDSYGKLFIGRNTFEKQYGVTTELLVQKYNYQDFVKTSESKGK